MWFDAQAALAEIEAGGKLALEDSPRANRAIHANPEGDLPPRLAQLAPPPGPNLKTDVALPPPATIATTATITQAPRIFVADVAVVAAPRPQKMETTPSASDPETYLAFLRSNGPCSYGAAAVALGWGATRAWQADARIRADGRDAIDNSGKTDRGLCRDDGRGG